MRLPSTRFVPLVALVLVASLGLAQAAVDGIDRDLVARVTRGGVQRLDADGGHCSAECADVTSVFAASPTTVGLDDVVTADRAVPRRAAIAPTSSLWLPRLTPTSPRSEPFPSAARGRAPPSA